MYKPGHRPVAFVLVLVILLAILTPCVSAGDSPLLVVRVPDTLLESGQQNVRIPVYLTNYHDIVAGFEIWVQLSHDGVLEFHEEIDTVGTLLSGWEFIDSRHLYGQPNELKVAGIADQPGPPATPGISPQQEDLPLYYMIADVFDLADTASNRSVDLIVQHHMLDHFNFSDPDGNSIGVIEVWNYDTTYLRCKQWAGSTCLNWTEVPYPPYDSLAIDSNLVPQIDTGRVFTFDGYVEVEIAFACGDINGSGGIPDISDIIYLVNYMFNDGPPPPDMTTADADGSGGVLDIADLLAFVSYMWQDGPQPTCGR